MAKSSNEEGTEYGKKLGVYVLKLSSILYKSS